MKPDNGHANGAITWTNERRRLSDLIPWPRNPRQIKKDQAERLANSFDEFGQVETLAIGPGNEIYNGHQRLNVLAAENGPDYEVDVRVASRPLTEKEREKLVVYLHKGAAGEWDFDTLANEFEFDDLVAWGFRPFELGIQGEGIDPNEEWKGMPEYNGEGIAPIKELKVNFRTEEDYRGFADLVGQKLTIKTRSIWYPERPKELIDQLGTKEGLRITNES